MATTHTSGTKELRQLLEKELPSGTMDWLMGKMDSVRSHKSARDLFLTYTLTASKVEDRIPDWPPSGRFVADYIRSKGTTLREAARIYLLAAVLDDDREFFSPKAAKLIEVADKSELETFLSHLPLLPYPEDFRNAAVEALRTNISTVFDAIALDNPYPAANFNDQQWNQMYLKAAFMQRDLSRIRSVDERANSPLARIISDYAHERWAASRDIDPMIWRPVTAFVDGVILDDMKRLLKSEKRAERRAGALCCFHSENQEAKELLKSYPELRAEVQEGNITWEQLND